MILFTRVGTVSYRLASRYLPDPFVFTLFLTLIAFAVASVYQFALGHSWGGVGDLLIFWQTTGFWQYLEFGMQIVLILVTGHAVATAPIVLRVIRKLASWPRSGPAAVFTVAWVSIVAGILHWGLALILGAYLCRETARAFQARGEKVHYPLLGAAAYLGLMVWHGGLSGSAPLVMNTPGHFLSDYVETIPVAATLFSGMNLSLLFVFLVTLPILISLLYPRSSEAIEPAPLLEEETKEEILRAPETPAERWEQSDLLLGLVAVIGFVSLFVIGWGRFRLNLNSLNFVFLLLGMALHRTPRNYLRAITAGVKGTSGIILLFPFYAGIFGLLTYDDMAQQFMRWLTATTHETLFAPLTFLSAGLLNLFVPSGGGQWGIQGAMVLEGAKQLGIPYSKMVMAVAYGDEWTNMLQPFWVLPILQITGLKARQVIGYTTVILIAAFPLYLLALLIF